MYSSSNERAQWALHLIVYHGPTWGHRIAIETQRQGQEPIEQPGGRWKGIGIPEAVLTDVTTTVNAILTEHFVTRYGVQGELPVTWAGEPDPF